MALFASEGRADRAQLENSRRDAEKRSHDLAKARMLENDSESFWTNEWQQARREARRHHDNLHKAYDILYKNELSRLDIARLYEAESERLRNSLVNKHVTTGKGIFDTHEWRKKNDRKRTN